MTDDPHPDALELAALLCSRLCHDLSSPINAIANGSEIMRDEPDAETRALAMDLIADSVERVAARLRFVRLAFGASGNGQSEISLDDVEAAARGVLEGDKITLSWSSGRPALAKAPAKLLLNLTLVAASCIPRGGRISAEVSSAGAPPRLRLTAAGLNARIPGGVERLLVDGAIERPIDVHLVQIYYARRLLEAADMRLAFRHDGDSVIIDALPRDDAA